MSLMARLMPSLLASIPSTCTGASPTGRSNSSGRAAVDT
jgi:hypothetical protein